ICVVGESIGTGPACMLAKEARPPDKIVLVVPFDKLASVAAEHAPNLLVRLFLGSTWDNIDALSTYTGPVEIFGASEDEIIKIEHAKTLAQAVPSEKFPTVPGGNNEWSTAGRVQIRNP